VVYKVYYKLYNIHIIYLVIKLRIYIYIYIYYIYRESERISVYPEIENYTKDQTRGEAHKLCSVQLHFTYVKLKLSTGDNDIPPGHRTITTYIGQMKICNIINI